MAQISEEEARVLGALLEKEATTPDYYPLTLNALRNACNQTSSRDPVVSYDEAMVQAALAGLREKGLARVVYSRSNRAVKYRHVLEETLGLAEQERAIICLLLLRGPQTAAELRSRSERLADFSDPGDLEQALDRLGSRPDRLVQQMERLPGHREARFEQLLADTGARFARAPAGAASPGSGARAPAPAPGPADAGLASRVAALEAEVASLRDLVEAVRVQVEYLVSQLS